MIIQWPDFLHRKPLYKPEVISISILLFSSIGMISPGRMHLYLALLFRRDYFAQVRCIPIWLFCSTGIISASQIHPCLALLFRRDYFRRLNSSLSCTFSPQGLFPPAKFIPTLLFCSTRIISPDRIHLYPALLLHKDYSGRPDASLSSSFSPQGLFRPTGFIPILLFCSTGIISAGQISPIAESISARPFRHLHIVPRQNNCTGRQLPTTD